MQERLVFIDALKGFLIITVIWGHVIQFCGISDVINDYIYYHWILTFHMPLFSIISGFCFHSKDLWITFTKRTKALIIPLLTWCSIFTILIPVLSYIRNGMTHQFDCYTVIQNWWYWVYDYGWWFLKALFFSTVYASLVKRIMDNRIIEGAILSILFLYCCSLFGIIPNMHPLFKGFIFIYPFFQIGIILKHYWEHVLLHIKHLFFCSLILYTLLLLFWEGLPDTFYYMDTCFNFYLPNYHLIYKIIYRFLIGTMGSLTYFLFFFAILSKYPGLKITKLFSKIGRHTIELYILSTCLNDYLYKIPFHNNNSFLLILECFFISIILLILCILLSNTIKKIQFILFYLGKKEYVNYSF